MGRGSDGKTTGRLLSPLNTSKNKKPLTTPLTFYRNWLNINLINSLSRCESQLHFQKIF
nr:MAG TPA: hypothetical protein [Bacteriophage sp.]